MRHASLPFPELAYHDSIEIIAINPHVREYFQAVEKKCGISTPYIIAPVPFEESADVLPAHYKKAYEATGSDRVFMKDLNRDGTSLRDNGTGLYKFGNIDLDEAEVAHPLSLEHALLPTDDQPTAKRNLRDLETWLKRLYPGNRDAQQAKCRQIELSWSQYMMGLFFSVLIQDYTRAGWGLAQPLPLTCSFDSYEGDIYVATSLHNLRLHYPETSAKDPEKTIKYAGEIRLEFKLTTNGFVLTGISTSNSVLQQIVLGADIPSNFKDIQKNMRQAAFEEAQHTYELARTTLQTSINSASHNSSELIKAAAEKAEQLLDAVEGSKKGTKDPATLALLTDILKETHKVLENPSTSRCNAYHGFALKIQFGKKNWSRLVAALC